MQTKKKLPLSNFNLKPLLAHPKVLDTIKMLGYQPMSYYTFKPILEELCGNGTDPYMLHCYIFSYGYILGKRAERAKKKGTCCEKRTDIL